jgi:hypothetical protein
MSAEAEFALNFASLFVGVVLITAATQLFEENRWLAIAMGALGAMFAAPPLLKLWLATVLG